MDVGKKTYKRRHHFHLKFKLVERIKLCPIRVDFVFIQLFDCTLSIHNLIESIWRSHIIFLTISTFDKDFIFPQWMKFTRSAFSFVLLFSPKMGAVILKNTVFKTKIDASNDGSNDDINDAGPLMLVDFLLSTFYFNFAPMKL